MQRQRLNRDGVKSQGAYMEPAADGNWVAYSDAASKIAELERERDDANYRAKTHGDALAVACRGTTHRSAMELRAALEDATRRLSVAVAEVRAWRAWKKRVVRYMTCESPDPTPRIEALKASSAATDADPVLRAMIGGGE